ncbi:hypothetical protein GUI12_02390 [Anaplasmataceae bacterium AB001_6]|nr:hypothetical protein GUI12_02390 [Anaplasmataceae bacterium AB001_6]
MFILINKTHNNYININTKIIMERNTAIFVNKEAISVYKSRKKNDIEKSFYNIIDPNNISYIMFDLLRNINYNASYIILDSQDIQIGRNLIEKNSGYLKKKYHFIDEKIPLIIHQTLYALKNSLKGCLIASLEMINLHDKIFEKESVKYDWQITIFKITKNIISFVIRHKKKIISDYTITISINTPNALLSRIIENELDSILYELKIDNGEFFAIFLHRDKIFFRNKIKCITFEQTSVLFFPQIKYVKSIKELIFLLIEYKLNTKHLILTNKIEQIQKNKRYQSTYVSIIIITVLLSTISINLHEMINFQKIQTEIEVNNNIKKYQNMKQQYQKILHSMQSENKIILKKQLPFHSNLPAILMLLERIIYAHEINFINLKKDNQSTILALKINKNINIEDLKYSILQLYGTDEVEIEYNKNLLYLKFNDDS